MATRDQLLALGCDQGQGYGFAKPLSPADFWAYVQAKGSVANASAVHGLAK